ncbi:MAG: hypothetical protein WAT92_21775 [Saprospiraceae bacterium]
MNWIVNNMEWLFSGIGTPLIVALFTLILLCFGLRKIKFKIKVDATITNENKSDLP